MQMRYRLPELIEKKGWTAYRLHIESGKRITLSVAYRLVKKRGKVAQFDGDVVEALCDTLGVSIGELLERDTKPKRRAGK